jgi:hypothetical protein
MGTLQTLSARQEHSRVSLDEVHPRKRTGKAARRTTLTEVDGKASLEEKHLARCKRPRPRLVDKEELPLYHMLPYGLVFLEGE